MNRKTICARGLVLTLFFLTTLLGAKAQTQLQTHVVKEGDTLYQLSTRYGITIDQILEYNPNIKSNRLKIGASVFIPTIESTPQKVNQQKASIREVHKVKRRETLFSISQEYGITIDELKAANPEMRDADYKLKKGKKINIPYPSKKVKKDKEVAPKPTPEKKEEKKVNNGFSTVKMAIMLPFTADAAGSNRCIEFYRGLLLSVEKMQAEGKNIELYAFNEPKAQSNIVTILEQIRQKKVNLIIGPLYFDHFAAVSRFAQTNKIKTLIPFSSKSTEIRTNPYLYLLNAPEEEKHEFASNLFVKNFSNSKAIFMTSNSKNESKFTEHLRKKLLQKGFEVADISLNSSDEQIKAVCNSKKENIFIPDGSTDADFEQTVARIMKFKKKYKQTNTAFFAYPEWQKFASYKRNEMHIVNTYVYTNAFYNPWSSTTNTLKNEYMNWFKSDIIESSPRMFMLGYDTGLTFINGLSRYGSHFNHQDLKLTLQQSDIAFKKISNQGGYINSSLWFVHYRNDYQIEKVSER